MIMLHIKASTCLEQHIDTEGTELWPDSRSAGVGATAWRFSSDISCEALLRIAAFA